MPSNVTTYFQACLQCRPPGVAWRGVAYAGTVIGNIASECKGVQFVPELTRLEALLGGYTRSPLRAPGRVSIGLAWRGGAGWGSHWPPWASLALFALLLSRSRLGSETLPSDCRLFVPESSEHGTAVRGSVSASRDDLWAPKPSFFTRSPQAAPPRLGPRESCFSREIKYCTAGHLPSRRPAGRAAWRGLSAGHYSDASFITRAQKQPRPRRALRAKEATDSYQITGWPGRAGCRTAAAY